MTAPSLRAPVSSTTPVQSLPALLCFGGLLVLLAAAPNYLSGFTPSDWNFWPQSLWSLLLAAVCLLAALSRITAPRWALVAWGIALFLGWSALAAVFGSSPHDAYLELARLTGALGVFFVARLFGSPTQRLTLILAAVLGVMWPALGAILDFAITRNPRQFGSFMNPNLFANALAMALPLALTVPLVIWDFNRNRALAISSTILFAACALALAVTSSKGGFLAALVGVFAAVIALRFAKKDAFNRLFRRSWPLLLIATLGFGVVGARTVGPRLLAARGADDNSTMFRAYTWRGTLEMARDKPVFGQGTGSFPISYPKFAQVGYSRTAHQSWLQIAAESGLPALGILLLVVGAALRNGARNLKTESWPFAAGALGALVALLVHGCLDAGWSATSVLVLLSVCLALLEPRSAFVDEADAPKSNLNYGFLGATLLLAFAGFGSQSAAQGEDALRQSQAFVDEGNYPIALERAREAIEIAPGSARAWTHLARLQAAMNDSGWQTSIERALQQAPNRAQTWFGLYRIHESKLDNAGVERALGRALELDPFNTRTRLERARWRLDHKNGRGYDDLEAIIKLWNAPYGRYPALADWANLDFARATLLLAPRLRQTKQTARLRSLLEHARRDLQLARAKKPENDAFLRAQGPGASPPEDNSDLASLEVQLESESNDLK